MILIRRLKKYYEEVIFKLLREEFRKRMTDLEIRCDLHLYENQRHGFLNFEHGINYYKTVFEADKFLASLGYLKGEPTLQIPLMMLNNTSEI